MVELVLRSLAFAFWSPPISFLVSNYLSTSTHRLRYALLCLRCPLFVLLNSSILWLFASPYDEALQTSGPRTFQDWMEMIRGGLADPRAVRSARHFARAARRLISSLVFYCTP
jgi:hypothetical protein